MLSSKIESPMWTRRRFLNTGAAVVATSAFAGTPFSGFAAEDKRRKITILHTNDVHSRIEPFPMDGGKYQGMGGVAARKHLIDQIRKEEENVLLLDAGDMFQGTPYFNFYKGEIEMRLMNRLQYDAATIGNHDFDAGMEGLEAQIKNAQFPILNANYDFNDTSLYDKVQPFRIFERNELKIGVFGLGVELEGLVPSKLYGNTRYKNPISEANRIADQLKFDYHCNLVVCLSHLGYEYDSDKVSDVILASQSRSIDLIIGGHTHTFLDEPAKHENLDGKAVLINQVGWAGIMLGRIDFYFETRKKKRIVNCVQLTVK